ncbi:MAG: flagellar basal body L-ring protein FlgH [Bacteriovoracaceae bacterium]|jgi:flagellar basal body L-ring protein FlgH|nr:hypothetical protein [Halobacteriovoraceae bacterium]MDP7321798.1 flagellar basal body L-ring protein FlgH [Bacteriovoracaceae bacterium]
MKNNFLIFLIFLCSSCASYVQSIHRQIDNEQRARQYQRYQNQPNKRYQAEDKRPINNPVTLNGMSTASNTRNQYPNVKRNYSTKGTRRYQASDLVDNQSDGSLWSGKNSESFLFVNNNLKRQGDIVIIEVMKDLKDTIQEELKRNFPEPKKAANANAPNQAAEAEQPEPATQDSPDKVYDKISTTVIEQVNQDYLLVRGRKEVMFRKYKRYFEIQAIVSQKDITSRDTVSSVKLLEPKINVLRY